MVEKRKEVRASELPVCPFCQGSVHYNNWLTHRIFQMECEQCNAHWRTGIKKDESREMFVTLVSSKNPEISNEYFEKELPLEFWQDMIKNFHIK